MAKQVNTNLFAHTGQDAPPEDNSDLDTGKISPCGVGLRAGEMAAVDVIAAANDLSRNALIRLAVRLFILGYRSGKIDLSEWLEVPKAKKKINYQGTH